MATLVQSTPASPRPWTWFREFLKEELAPYPGRAALTARMVVAATLVMLVTMTFRIPFGIQAIYAFGISRESPRATVRAVMMASAAFALAAAYVIVGATFAMGDPMLHLLWVMATLFIGFYAITTITDYSTATGFGILVAITIPLWDRHIPAELRVEGTLWAAGQTIIAGVTAALAGLLFAGLKPADNPLQPVAQRLAAVEDLLNCYAADCPMDENSEKELTRVAMVGTSRLRRLLRRSAYSPHYREQMAAVVELVGRLVDIAANLRHLTFKASGDDRQRMRILAENIGRLRADLLSGNTPRLAQSYGEVDNLSAVPLLREMERTVSLVAEVFEGTTPLSAYAPPPSPDEAASRLFVHDALSNLDHVKFALKGCLAASLCYIIYTALDWPEISTAVVTCVLTALTTIGASRQKQVLRFTGALAGGLVGIAALVFILPYLDSIAGFTILFLLVTIPAAWIATSSPRISYFGVQLALAFYLMNLQEFKTQTSLVVARDRVLGILLGLVMMWLVFDQLWGSSAGIEMRKTFISILRLLAQLAREPRSTDRGVVIERTYSLRETINDTFDKVRTLADAVLFEFGPSRQQDLALRDRVRRWQPQLRLLFLTRIALLKYRLQLPGFELPEPVRLAQQEFDEQSAMTLEHMADRLEGKAPKIQASLEESRERLEQTVRACASDEHDQALAGRLQTLISLSRTMERLLILRIENGVVELR